MTIQISNWNEFIHYKDRPCPWIKLRKNFATNRKFQSLSPLAVKCLVVSWMIADKDGKVNHDEMEFAMRLPMIEISAALSELNMSEFLVYHDASNVLALCTTKEKLLEKQKRFNPEAYLLSLGVNDEVSADWLQHRKAKKAPATKTSIDRINDEASKACMSLQEALETMCQRGWTGFKSDWVQSNNYTAQRQERDSATIRALGLSQARTFDMGDL